MKKTIIHQAHLVNEGKIAVMDLLICDQRIEKIAPAISDPSANTIDASGLYLFPGMIDDQVHFRDPGLTHKGNIASESRAAVAGGITSFMDMPNTIPNTLTQSLLEEKYQLAAQHSVANYSFFMGISQNNLDEALKTDPTKVCGITDDGLYFNNDEGILANYPDFLEKLFSRTDTLIALHSENDEIIKTNFNKYKALYGDNIPWRYHAKIRSEQACVSATKEVIALAEKHQNRLHFFHISTQAEALLFSNKLPISQKRITAEACIHHLWFTEQDYDTLGAKIKWNPSIKTAEDKAGLMQALLDNRLDIIATDHAPHTMEEKSGTYPHALSGAPMVQHALPVLFELYHQGKISLEKIAEKTSHHVSELYQIKDRGYIREGYYADLVLVDLDRPWTVSKDNLLYHCGWSPLEHQTFKSAIVSTFVNGTQVYHNGKIIDDQKGQRLRFDRITNH